MTLDLPEALPDRELLDMLKGTLYRGLSLRDRMPDDPLALRDGLNYASGVPESANALKLGGQVTLQGEKLARQAYLSPATLAQAHIRQKCKTCDACTSGTDGCTNGPLLTRLKRSEWNPESVHLAAELEARIQEVFRNWSDERPGQAEKHRGGDPPWIERSPPIVILEGRERVAPDDDAWACRLTSAGIAHLRAYVPKHRPDLASGPSSIMWAFTDAQRRNAPQWLQEEFKAEGGTISGPPDEKPLSFFDLDPEAPPERRALAQAALRQRRGGKHTITPEAAAELKNPGGYFKGFLDWLRRKKR